jgi:hypothetical protein
MICDKYRGKNTGPQCVNFLHTILNRFQDVVREDGRIVGGEEWQETVYNRKEWKELLGMARNCHILHMPMESMYEHSISHINLTWEWYYIHLLWSL